MLPNCRPTYQRPRKTTPALRAEIRRSYLRREHNQTALAVKYGVSQSTIARCIADSYAQAPAS